MSTTTRFPVGERVAIWTQPTRYVAGEVVAPPMGRSERAGLTYVRLGDGTIRWVDTTDLTPLADAGSASETQLAETPFPFGLVLRGFRERRKRLSQSRLGEMAGLDHSYVSRLESGTRMPTRDAASKLAEALGLDDAERDTLLASAGFLPADTRNLFNDEPVVGEVIAVLRDGTVPAAVREDVRSMIRLLVRQAQRQAVSS